MIFFLLVLPIASDAFLRAFPPYSDLLASLESFSVSDRASLETIGYSTKGRHIKALYIDMKKPLDCLVVGGIEGNGHLTSLEIIKLIENAYDRFLQFNVWFVPVLNIDSFLQVEELYTQGSEFKEISKNQKDTGCFNLVHRGVDLDRNFSTSCFSDEGKCERHYQGAIPFSESETQAIQSLMENHPIALVIGYFTGGTFFSSYDEDLLKRLNLDNIYLNECGSLENYAKSKGALSLVSYISDEMYPSHPEIFISRQIPMFFRVLKEVAPHFIYSKEESQGKIKIHITNKGFIRAEKIILSIETSTVISNSNIVLRYGTIVEQYYMENLRTFFILKIGKLEASETAEVKIEYNSVSNVIFYIQMHDYDAEEIPILSNRLTYQLILGPKVLIASSAFVFLSMLMLWLCYLCKQPKPEPKFIRVPNRSPSFRNVSENN